MAVLVATLAAGTLVVGAAIAPVGDADRPGIVLVNQPMPTLSLPADLAEADGPVVLAVGPQPGRPMVAVAVRRPQATVRLLSR